MTRAKRGLDLVLALVLSAVLALPVALLAGLLLFAQGRPVFHRSERMMAPGRPFWLWKLRTMDMAVADGGVTGGHKAARITPVGRVLRRTRLDEAPQLWNILRGEMSLVGPRPPLRSHVERCPDLFGRVLRNRPGLTGLATLRFRRAEERILAACRSPEETEAAYLCRCLPRKARLDLIYQRRQSVWLDLAILTETLRELLVPRAALHRRNRFRRVRPVLRPAGTVRQGNAGHASWLRDRAIRAPRSVKTAVLLGLDALAGIAAISLTMLPSDAPAPVAGVAALGLAITALSASLGLHRIKLVSYDQHGILRSVCLAVLASALFALIVEHRSTSSPLPQAATFGLAFLVLAVALRRLLLSAYLAVLRHGQVIVPVVIYGAGDTGMQLLSALRQHVTIRPVALVDDNPDLQGMTLAGLRVQAPSRIGEIARMQRAERVILAMPSLREPHRDRLARGLALLGLEVQTVPSFAQLVSGTAPVDRLLPVVPGRVLGRAQVDPLTLDAAAQYRGRSVMITGAGGTIGAGLARSLAGCAPHCLVLVEQNEGALYAIEKDLRRIAHQSTGIVPVLGSVADRALVETALRGNSVDAVFHAAAYKHVPMLEHNPVVGAANNVLGTRTLAEAAAAAGVKRFVLVSTDKAVRPGNVMGATKRLAEMVVQDLARRTLTTAFSIVRFGNVLGSSGSVVPLFQEQIASGGPVTLTHDEVSRYFMSLSEASRLLLSVGAFAQDIAGRADVFVLDMGQPVRIRDLAVRMIESAGRSVSPGPGTKAATGAIEIRTIGLRPGEKLHEELLIGQSLLPTPQPGILRAMDEGPSEFEVARALHQLRMAIDRNDAADTRRVLFRWVESEEALSRRAPE